MGAELSWVSLALVGRQNGGRERVSVRVARVDWRVGGNKLGRGRGVPLTNQVRHSHMSNSVTCLDVR